MKREQIEARLAELEDQAEHFAMEMQRAQRELIAVQARIAECELWLERMPVEPEGGDQSEGWTIKGAKT